jgi:hypothetical protein
MTDHPGVPYARRNTNESGCKQGTHMGNRTVYRIVVRGELSERYAMAFEGMEMETKDGDTILTGEVDPDKAEIIKLDPANVVTVEEAAQKRNPLIKPLPWFDAMWFRTRASPPHRSP